MRPDEERASNSVCFTRRVRPFVMRSTNGLKGLASCNCFNPSIVIAKYSDSHPIPDSYPVTAGCGRRAGVALVISFHTFSMISAPLSP